MEKIIGIFVIAVIVIAVLYFVDKSNESSIKEWATKNKYEVVNIEQVFLNLGPFYYVGKGQQCYKIDIKTATGAKVFYMRTGLFGDEYEEYKK